MPIKERVALVPPKRIIKPLPSLAQTFAPKHRIIKKLSINRIQGEIKSVMDKYRGRTGVVRLAVEQRTAFGRIATGILSVDLCLAGGFMRSHGCMLIGNKSTGKTTLSLMALAGVQLLEPESVGVFVDIEGSLDLGWAQRLGVDIERLLVVEPESGEEAVDISDGLFRTAETSMVIVDSIAMLIPMKEVEEDASTSIVGSQPRLVTKFLRKMHQAMLTERHRGHFPSMVLLNQYRMKIGVSFGDPRVLPGGNALEYASSQTLETYNHEHKVAKGDAADMVIFNEHEVHVRKDKTGGKLKAAKFKLIRDEEQTGFPVGFIPQAHTIVNWGTPAGIITGRYDVAEFGKFKSFDDINRFLLENPLISRDLCWRICEHYRTKWGVT